MDSVYNLLGICKRLGELDRVIVLKTCAWGWGGRCCLAFYVATHKSLYDLRGSKRMAAVGCGKGGEKSIASEETV